MELRGCGSGAEHRDVPEQQLQQQRDVADHFDVDRRDLGDHPVRRQARDADREAEDVAKKMPMAATSSVLSRPTRKASP